MKKLFYTALIFVLITVTFTSCLTTKIDSNKESRSYKTINFTEEADFLRTEITYPSFEAYPDLSKMIKNTIFSNWENFKSYSDKEWNDLNEINSKNGKSSLPPFEYLVQTEVYNSSSKYISILINTYIFNGGAHGNTNLISYNYNIDTSKYDKITTVTGMDYNQLSDIVRKKLYDKLITNNPNLTTPAQESDLREMINTGAFPQAGNFQIFTVGKQSVTVYFEPYSVAPYSYGIQKVELKIE